jgi:putative ABC transport system permease protein
MNYLLFIIKSALDDFARNKVRTFLTSLGILIGVASVVILIAFGLGLKKYISDQFESLGTNLIIVLPGKIFSNGRFRQGGSAVTTVQFEEKDINLLKKVKGATYIVPVFTKASTLEAEAKTELSDIFISTADIFPVRNFLPTYGRLYDKGDLEKRAKVVVMGPKIAEKLYGSADVAIGKSVKINSQNFKVIGVLQSKGGGGFGGPDFDSFTYIPYTSAISLNPNKKFVAFYVKSPDAESVATIKEEVKTAMLKRYKEDDFSIAEQSEILDAVSGIFAVLNSVLVSIAAISLIVGGIGIMNIMYVSVIERVREIGIRRALGATKRDILSQFVTEAVLLSVFGGLLGLALSFIIVLLVQKFFPAYINWQSVAIALGVSSAIGVIFGVFPARKAANLSPIEAIRYE